MAPYGSPDDPNIDTQIMERLMTYLQIHGGFSNSNWNWDAWRDGWLWANIIYGDQRYGGYMASAIDARDPDHMVYKATIWNSHDNHWHVETIINP